MSIVKSLNEIKSLDKLNVADCLDETLQNFFIGDSYPIRKGGFVQMGEPYSHNDKGPTYYTHYNGVYLGCLNDVTKFYDEAVAFKDKALNDNEASKEHALLQGMIGKKVKCYHPTNSSLFDFGKEYQIVEAGFLPGSKAPVEEKNLTVMIADGLGHKRFLSLEFDSEQDNFIGQFVTNASNYDISALFEYRHDQDYMNYQDIKLDIEGYKFDLKELKSLLIAQQQIDYCGDIEVDMNRSMETVEITSGSNEIFLQGHEASEFIHKVNEVYEELKCLSMEDAAKVYISKNGYADLLAEISMDR